MIGDIFYIDKLPKTLGAKPCLAIQIDEKRLKIISIKTKNTLDINYQFNNDSEKPVFICNKKNLCLI